MDLARGDLEVQPVERARGAEGLDESARDLIAGTVHTICVRFQTGRSTLNLICRYVYAKSTFSQGSVVEPCPQYLVG